MEIAVALMTRAVMMLLVLRPSTWKTATTDEIPPIRDSDITNYFIYHKNPTLGYRLTFERQLKKARTFTEERYVTNVEIGIIYQNGDELDISCVRAKCQASMKELQYSVYLYIITETGMVQTAECTCKAGKSGVCAHAGALLLSLVKIREACTSQSCQWKAPPPPPMTNVQLEAKQFCDIVLYNPERATAVKRRPYPGVYNAGPVVNAGAFVRDLLDGMETCNSDCALFLTLRRTPHDISEFLDIFNVPFCYADSVQLADVKDTLQEFATYLELNSNIDTGLIENLEKSIRGQGVNVNRKRAGSVVVTASHMGSIVKRQKLELDALVKAIM